MIKSSKVKQDKERKGYKFRLIVPNSDTERQLAKIVSASDAVSFEYQGKQITSNQLDSVNPLREHQAKLAKLQKDLKTKLVLNV